MDIAGDRKLYHLATMDVAWLRQELLLRGIRQAELAQAVGMTEGQLSKVMRGSRRLLASEADAIRRHLGYTPPEEMSQHERGFLALLDRMTENQKRLLDMYVATLLDRPAPPAGRDDEAA